MRSSTVRTFSEPDEFHAAIRDAQAAGTVTERGDFRAELTNIRLDRVALQRSRETLPRVAYSAFNPERFGVVFATSPGQQIYINGLEMRQTDIVVFRAGSEGYNRSLTAPRWGSIALIPEDIATAGYALIGRELTPPPVTQRVAPPSYLLSRLLSLHEAAGRLAKTAPDILAKPAVARRIEDALLEALIACLARGQPVDQQTAYRHHAKVMRRFEEVLRGSGEGPLYVGDLARAVGVSYRTLLIRCQEHLGMSPKRYLLLRRMHLARRALRKASKEAASVTDIATNYGFWELGRFSVVYRSLFGESPSATLRRSPEI
jgi:AraC-like DNA-binding protein